MFPSFFTSQKLADSKNIKTHLEYLLGNIALVHPADTNDRTRWKVADQSATDRNCDNSRPTGTT